MVPAVIEYPGLPEAPKRVVATIDVDHRLSGGEMVRTAAELLRALHHTFARRGLDLAGPELVNAGSSETHAA
jgi:hypothetical protein